MTGATLTDHKARALPFIQGFYQQHGRGPTVNELWHGTRVPHTVCKRILREFRAQHPDMPFKRSGAPLKPLGSPKTCPSCGQAKPLTAEFWPMPKQGRWSTGHRFGGYCRPCHNARTNACRANGRKA